MVEIEIKQLCPIIILDFIDRNIDPGLECSCHATVFTEALKELTTHLS